MRIWIFCLVAGLVLLVVGVILTGEPVVRCAGVPMAPGAVCESATGSGEVVARKTYAEVEQETQAAQRTRDAWGLAAFVGGAVLILSGAAGVVVRRRRRANQDPSPADLFFQRRAAAQAAPPSGPPSGSPSGPSSDDGPPAQGPDSGSGSGDDVNPRPS